jgi:type I restriction enzyme M protein
MLAVLRPGGMVATVMPHGILFRGGAERDIRKGFLHDDLLEAVIGLAPNLFYGTGIPASVLILRAKGGKPAERRGKVLFINADAEYEAGRAQNYLLPEHVEKIANAFERFENIHGFATVMTIAELEKNDWNLNIRRCADNAPAPEPHDVRAHLMGGVPKTEIEALRPLFEAHGFDPMTLFAERDARYLDFRPDLTARADLKTSIEADPAVKGKEALVTAVFTTWWDKYRERLVRLPETHDLMAARAEFLWTFAESLVPVGLLDRFHVAGVLARWWGEVQFDLKALSASGFDGLLEGWVTTVVTALEEDGGKSDPLGHKVLAPLMGDFLGQIADAEARVAELDGRTQANAQIETEDGEEAEDDAERLSDAEEKELKRQLTAAKKTLKALHKTFAERIEQARIALGPDAVHELVLGILKSDLEKELARYVAAHRQQVVAAIEKEWDILDTSDDTIRRTEQVIAKLQQMKRGLLHDLLTRGVDEHGNLRRLPSEAPHLYKDSALGQIPANWDCGPLASVVDSIEAGWSPSCPAEAPRFGDWGVLKVSALSSGVYCPQESKLLPPPLVPIRSLEVRANDVLCVRANGVRHRGSGGERRSPVNRMPRVHHEGRTGGPIVRLSRLG